MLCADYIKQRRIRLEQALEHFLPPAATEPHRLHQAMRYAVLNGGKRLRPLLVYMSGEAADVPLEKLDAPACAIELIHAYSLVHDDLPAMDDDDLRRGQPTCHKAFDEATAILVGDSLQSLAFQVLAQAEQSISAAHRIQMIQILAKASGASGMAGGQAIDLAANNQPLSLAEIEQLHSLKTGALITASVELGLLAADTIDIAKLEAMRQYAQHLGLAFQIHDDIKDIEGSVESLGKIPGNDEKHQKSTYPAIAGLTAAKAKIQSLHQQALSALTSWDDKGNYLRQLTNDILTLQPDQSY